MNFNALIKKANDIGRSIGLLDIFKLWNIVNKAIAAVKAIKQFISDDELTEAEASESARLLNVMLSDIGIIVPSGQTIWVIKGCWAIYKAVKK